MTLSRSLSAHMTVNYSLSVLVELVKTLLRVLRLVSQPKLKLHSLPIRKMSSEVEKVVDGLYP